MLRISLENHFGVELLGHFHLTKFIFTLLNAVNVFSKVAVPLCAPTFGEYLQFGQWFDLTIERHF